MRGIGLMANTMVMGSKRGREVAVTEVSTGRVFDMDLASIDFIQGMFTLESGPMARVMAVEFILARMGVDMLVNSSGVSSMALDITISGIICLGCSWSFNSFTNFGIYNFWNEIGVVIDGLFCCNM